MEFLKNKTVLIAGVVVLIIALFAAVYFMFFANTSTEDTQTNTTVDTGLQEISPDEIGLELTASPEGNQIKFTINKADGIESISYEIIYEADSTAQEVSDGAEPRVQRGIIGEDNLSGGSTYESDWIDLGSASKNVVRYDTGVESVQMVLKLTKEDGSVLATETTLKI